MASPLRISRKKGATAPGNSRPPRSRGNPLRLAALVPTGRPSLEQQIRLFAENDRLIAAACRLHGNLEVVDGVQRLLFSQYRQIIRHWKGAVAGAHPVALHELRVAIRKARAVLRGFRKRLKPTSARQLDRHLRRLNRALGPARDLDVWIAWLQDPRRAGPPADQPRPERYLARQRNRRRRQQTTVRRVLGAGAFLALHTRFDQLLRNELPRLRADSAAAPFLTAAYRVLEKQLRCARKLGKLRWSTDPARRHRLRIALRRVRYLAGFFAPLLEPAVDQLRQRTHAVEQALGEICDTTREIERLRDEHPSPPAGLPARLRARRRQAETALEAAWSRFDDHRFRRELRAVLHAGR